MQTVLIVGATGTLGSLIAEPLLANKKTNVRILVRKGSEEKAQKLVDAGAKLITGDLINSTVEELTEACSGVNTVVSAIIGGRDVTVDGQKKLAEAAEKAGVTTFIPSDYSADFHKCDYGDCFNFDQRKELAEHLKNSKLNVVSVLNGGFYEIFKNFYNLEQKVIPYYGSPDQNLQFTTYADTGRMVVELVESGEPASGKFGFAGADISPKQIKAMLERITGESFELVNKGSVEDLYAKIQETKKNNPHNLYSYLFDQYKYTMFSGKGYIENKFEPKTFKFTQLEDFVAKMLKK
jgi:nucleoside-diphosphate-sugar epimerase